MNHELSKCKKCYHHRLAYGKGLCLALDIPKPIEYMRHEKSECGPEAKLFDDKDEYMEIR